MTESVLNNDISNEQKGLNNIIHTAALEISMQQMKHLKIRKSYGCGNKIFFRRLRPKRKLI